MPKEGRILVILTTEEKAEFRKIAEAQNRSMSGLAAFIIKEWLAQNKS